jgi:DNA (cytosine-5)-methyltransferase 1
MPVLKPWTAIDLFGGCGGLTTGLKRAGFHVISTVERDELAASTYSANHPQVRMLNQDIRHVPTAALLGDEQSSIDLVAGCPPCQGFSRVRRCNRRRAKRDPRNSLIYEFQRVIEELRPQAVFMENVPGIERDFRFKRFIARLEELEYLVTLAPRVQLADYGIPQRRTRVVVLAGKGFEIPMPRKSRRKRTVRDTIGSLARPRDSRNRLHRLVTDHAPDVLTRIRAVPLDGGSRLAWPDELQLQCHRDCNGFKDVYGRMAWQEPSPTITGGCINASKGRFLHPRQHRVITLLEAALLQTFPYRYYFDLVRGRYAAAEMIGNALPPLFAGRVARCVARALQSNYDDGHVLASKAQ